MSALVALVTLGSLLLYFWTTFSVGRARARLGVAAPAMTGNPEFERIVRVQANTLEWLVIYLPSLWLFAAYVSAPAAAAIGVVWIAGRVVYARGYAREARQRGLGFAVQAAATMTLFLGALVGVVLVLARGGA